MHNPNQGCQIVYLHVKIPIWKYVGRYECKILVYFRHLVFYVWSFGPFYGQYVGMLCCYWVYFSTFGTLFQYKSGKPAPNYKIHKMHSRDMYGLYEILIDWFGGWQQCVRFEAAQDKFLFKSSHKNFRKLSIVNAATKTRRRRRNFWGKKIKFIFFSCGDEMRSRQKFLPRILKKLFKETQIVHTYMCVHGYAHHLAKLTIGFPGKKQPFLKRRFRSHDT
jgi:hypothetical protein